MAKGKVLGIDYGQKSIGLAVSDQDRMMAFGKGVVRGLEKQKVLEKIVDLIKNENISEIVVGLPLGPGGEHTGQTAVISEFAGHLKKALKEREMPVPVGFMDESFSSFEANKILANLGVKGPDRKKTEDEMAAIILVQRFIDFRP